MALDDEGAGAHDLLDVRRASELVGRHPETVRRWVWSGRLEARRRGGRLLVRRGDVLAAASQTGAAIALDAWAERARAARESAGATRSGRGAADLVLEDRAGRSQPLDARASR